MQVQIDNIKDRILPILQPYDVKKVGLFGSTIRGDMSETSDIDVLVDIGKDISLLDFIGLKLRLEDVLGRPVDLVEYATIKPALRERILREQVEFPNPKGWEKELL